MSTFNAGRILSGTAASATVAGTGGKNAANDTVTPCTVEGEAVEFVFTDDVDAGEPVGLYMPGNGTTIPVIAGGALDELDEVMVNTDAKFVLATAGKLAVGKVVRGSSAEAEDDEVVIEFYAVPQLKVPA